MLDREWPERFRIARGAHRGLAEAAPYGRGRSEAVREIDELFPLDDFECIRERVRGEGRGGEAEADRECGKESCHDGTHSTKRSVANHRQPMERRLHFRRRRTQALE